MSLHGNTYLVEPALSGWRVELVFSPFDMTVIEVRYQDKTFGPAIPHVIRRHTHPKARPEIPAGPPPATGIDYLNLVGDDHHRQRQADERIGYDALYGRAADPGQLPGQLSLADITDNHTYTDTDTDDTSQQEETA